MKIRTSIVVVMLFLLFGMGEAMAGRTAPLVDKSYAFDSKTPLTLEQVRDYILAGALRYKEELTSYTIQSDAPGAMQLEFNKKNEHFVSVLFVYTNEGFRTNYVTSKNLNYGEEKGVRVIHPNYMVWLDEMFKEMQVAQLMQLNAKGEPTNKDVVSELNFSTDNNAAIAHFDISESHKPCGEFDPVGYVKNEDADIVTAKKAVQAWNDRHKDSNDGLRTYTGPDSKRTRYVVGSKPVQLEGRASIGEAHCGPIKSRFTPESGKKYSVEMRVIYTGGRELGVCSQVIYDDTNPELRVLVPREEIPECKKKGWFR